MKARWITVLAVAAFMAALTPLAAQATTLEDPDDVGPGMIDIKSASVTATSIAGERIIALTVEAYEPFDCATLLDSRRTGNALGFAIDYLSTAQTPDLRIRVRCLDTGQYTWRVRFVESRLTDVYETVIRPTSTTLTVMFTGEWFGDIGGEEPARWKVTSARRVDFKPVEIDSAPDQGWSLFDSAAS
jgi:hypothetical protein